MKIIEFGWKNYKSYGNNYTVIKLDENEGSINLIAGKNGKGKSSILEIPEYVFYNKVRGNYKKSIKLSSLPNRQNKNLEAYVICKKNEDILKIKRGQQPTLLEVYENDSPNPKAGNANLDNVILDFIEMDLDTFKSFIAMSINDFKNFISLSTDDKKKILDKLFNLQILNSLNEVLKKMISKNTEEISVLEGEIYTLDDNIKKIQNSVDATKAKLETQRNFNYLDKQKEYKNIINTNKENGLKLKSDFDKIKEKLDKYKNLANSVDSEIIECNKSISTVLNDIKHLNNQIKLYDNDKCPTCQTDLSSSFHLDLKKGFIERLNKLNEVKDELESNRVKLTENKAKLRTSLTKGQTLYDNTLIALNKCKNEINIYKVELERLDKLNESKIDDSSLNEFLETIENLKTTKESKKIQLDSQEIKKEYHKQLKFILSENGVKKMIIQSIIEPINSFLKENLMILGVNHSVELNDEFDATVMEFGEEVDVETLSTGEMRKINIAIMIAYLKMMRTKKDVNIMFIDELFSGIDIEGIPMILELLKDYAKSSNIHIFVVHHALMDKSHFDCIYHVDKNVFSEITIM